jgi:hypothetical protein
LIFSSTIFLVPFLLCSIAVFGLWKGRMYGYVIALLGNLLSAAIFVVFARPLCIVPAALLICFLVVPNIRNFYVRNYYQ